MHRWRHKTCLGCSDWSWHLGLGSGLCSSSSRQASAAVGLKQSRFPTPCGPLGASGLAQVWPRVVQVGLLRKEFFSSLQPYVVLRKLVCALFTMLLSFITVCL